MKRLAIAFFSLLFLLTLVALKPLTVSANENPKAAYARGLVRIGQEEVVVEILAEARPGENPEAAAKAALRRAYPDAREIELANYSLNGLVWDVFKDGNAGNDYVTVNYNSSGVPANLSALNHRGTWLASQASWTNIATSRFTFSDGGNTSRCPSLVRECAGPQYFDSKNDVGWLNIKDPSVLGVTWYGTSRDEFDMVLDNRNFNWYVGTGTPPSGYYDTQTVWLHEFGHGAGLGHSGVDGAVMEPYYEGVRRVLHPDDISGISYLYP